MFMVDTLADALTNMKNCENVGREECIVRPASKLVGSVLKLMQKEGYVGNFEFVDDGKAGIYRVELLGKINDCKAIKPRFSVGYAELEKFEKRYLPARGFGIIILTTPNGVLTHKGAKEQKTGGKLLAFVY